MHNLQKDTPRSFTKRALGQDIEKKCSDFLQTQKIKVISHNFYSKLGEIDLIGIEADTLIFFEIRYRQNKGYGTALESVTFSKQQRIYKTALYFLMKNPQFARFTYRFDIIGASSYNGDIKQLTFDWQKNAFQPMMRS